MLKTERSSKISNPLVLTNHKVQEEYEPSQKPLEFNLIWRLLGYTKPHFRTRNWLLSLVLLRAIQLPFVASEFTRREWRLY